MENNDNTSLGKVMGAAVPPHLSNYISLFGLKFKLSNSEVLRVALKDWFNIASKRRPKEDLIRDILKMYQDQWDTIRMKNVSHNITISFQKFKNKVDAELTKRSIDEKDKIDIIHGIIFERS